MINKKHLIGALALMLALCMLAVPALSKDSDQNNADAPALSSSVSQSSFTYSTGEVTISVSDYTVTLSVHAVNMWKQLHIVWGDGQTYDSPTGYLKDNTVSVTHTYANTGNYTLSFEYVPVSNLQGPLPVTNSDSATVSITGSEGELTFSTPSTLDIKSGGRLEYKIGVSISGSTITKQSGASWLTVSDGKLTGTTPSVSSKQSYSVVLKAVSPGGQEKTQTFTVNVYPKSNITASSTSINATVGTSISAVTLSSNVTGTYSISSGSLPSGLSLSSSGRITGTPTESGTFTVTVRHTSSEGPYQTSTVSLTFNVTEPTMYTITFYSAFLGGNIKQVTVESGHSVGIEMPEDPTRLGYTFKSWNTKEDGSGTNFTSSTPVTSSYRVYAIFESLGSAKPGYVTYVANDGTDRKQDVAFGEYDKILAGMPWWDEVMIECPWTRSGYEFAGWAQAPSAPLGNVYQPGDIWSTTPLYVDTGVAFFAVWEPTNTVSFNSNGGTGSIDSISAKAGSVIDLPSSGFTKDGYLLSGWNTNSSGTGTAYDLGASYTVNSNATLYAVWEKNSFTVTFDANGGKFPADNTSTKAQLVTKNGTASKPEDPSKDASIFVSWKTATGDTYDFSSPVTEDITLRAQYTQHFTTSVEGNILTVSIGSDYQTALSHTVEWGDGTQSSSEMTTLTHAYSDSDSYRIKVTSREGGNVYTTYATVTISTVPTYTVTFNTNGGSAVPSQTVVSGLTAKSPDVNPIKDGYTFGGWYAGASLTTRYTFSEPVLSNTTVYAKWIKGEVSTYTVSFETNGGSAIAHQTVLQNEKATKPADPSRDGYTFGGWYSDKELTTEFDFNAEITQNTTAYAKWNENQSGGDDGGDGNDKTNENNNKNIWILIAAIIVIVIAVCAVMYYVE